MNTTVPNLADAMRITEAAKAVHKLLGERLQELGVLSPEMQRVYDELDAALNPARPAADPIPPADLTIAMAEFQAAVEKAEPGMHSFVRGHGAYISWPVHNMFQGWLLAKGLA